jgi:outer membrane protein assembly factor BamB
MKRILPLTILTVLLISSIGPGSGILGASSTSSPSSNQYKEGYRFNVQGWIYVHIQGDAYERGYQHGYLLSAEIVDMLTRWSNIIHNYPIIKSISTRQSDAKYEKMSQTWWNFCTKECYRMYWDKFPVEYQQEIKGIADGVTAQGGTLFGRNVNYQDILAMNEMYEFLSKLTDLTKGIHPLRTLFQQLQPLVPEIAHVNVSTLIGEFLRESPAHHCNGFIASGNATTHGQLVFSQTMICGGGVWWWTYYISLRWNVLLDVQPTTGHRITMPTSPGLIWSDEDYYQNDYGLVLLETTVPQGPYDNRGLPLSVRVRNAMQYGDTIDDMLYSLRYRNDGAMNAVWLLGDTKTGEIARLDLGYRHSAVWRTFNGFYWSANIPRDFSVRFERINLKTFMIYFIGYKIILRIPGWGYYSIKYIPEDRDLKFDELGKKYYGQIDIETVKQIMDTHPICDYITDAKATDSYLMKHNGLWAFFGNPHHSLNIANLDSRVVTTEEVPPTGWVRIFGVPVKEGFILPTREKASNVEETDVLWKYDTKDKENNFTSQSAVENNRLYETTSEGVLSSMNVLTGGLQWQVSIGANPTPPVAHDGFVYVGDATGLTKFSETGDKQWRIPTDGRIISRPVIIEDTILCSDSSGKLYALALTNGQEQWRLNVSNESYLSSTYDENLYLTAGNSCYAVARSNHTITWVFSSKGPITASPVLSNDTLYVSSWDNYVYALDAKTGTMRWRYQTGWGYDISPVVSKGTIFVGSMDNNLYALAEEGTLKWMFSCQAGIHSTPYVYGNYVFFGSDDGRVYALNQSTGKLVWSFAPRFTVDGVNNYETTPILSDPVVVNGTVVIGANGTIYGLNAQTIESPLRLEQKTVQSLFPEIPTSWYPWILIAVIVFIIISYAVLRKKK